MMHIKYPKILAVNKEECEGIFEGELYIQEKIDGANLQIGINEGGIYIGSRTQLVYSNGVLHKEFGGVEKYVLNHEGIIEFLSNQPQFVLYGEWLVKHTIIYPEKYYNKFYLFDIYNKQTDEFAQIDYVNMIAKEFNIETPELFYKGESTLEHAKTFVGKSSMEVPQEGIVIKNIGFINKRGNKQYGKIVREEFKEANQIVFGGYSKGDVEMEFATKYVTEARVFKIVHKIEQNESRKIDIKDTPRVMGMVYNDCFMEEMREFAGKRAIDFGELQKKCGQRSRYIFHDLLNNF